MKISVLSTIKIGVPAALLAFAIAGCTGAPSVGSSSADPATSSAVGISSSAGEPSSESSAASSDANAQKSGQALYLDLCASCHDEDGRAGGVYALNGDTLSEQAIYSATHISMPKQDHTLCEFECADKVTKYIKHELFANDAVLAKVGYSEPRLLTRHEYANLVRDVFQPATMDVSVVSQRLPQATRRAGFENNVDAVATESTLENLLELSESLAEQVVAQLDMLVDCSGGAMPPSPVPQGDQCNTTGQCQAVWPAADDCANSGSAQSICMCGNARCDAGMSSAEPELPPRECAQTFIDTYGPLAFRRPFEPGERDDLVALFESRSDFDQGIALATQGILVAAPTLYQSAAAAAQEAPLTGHELATRLSFLLWNTIPDQPLLDAAPNLHDTSNLRAQVARMLNDPRAVNGMAAFVTQWLEIDKPTAKLSVGLTQDAAAQASESVGLFFDYLVREEQGTFADLMLDRRAILTPALADIYSVNLNAAQGDYLGKPIVALPANERAGVLTRAGFITGHSHENFTSPTLRGKALRNRVLCQEIHLPPSEENNANIDAAAGLTGREFAEVHQQQGGACASCHAYLDELGLVLENYDTNGSYRITEGDTPIDATGFYYSLSPNDIAQQGAIDDAIALSNRLSSSEVAADCFAENWMRYALMRELTEDQPSVDAVKQRFKQSGYSLLELFMAIVESPAFTHQGPANRF